MIAHRPREADVAPAEVPAALAPLIDGYRWARDQVGESGGTVHRLHRPDRETLYLKHGAGTVAADIIDEAARLRWLGRHLPVPTIIRLVSQGDAAWLLMTAIPGRTAWQCLTDNAQGRAALVAAIAGFLRSLHALPAADCPFDSRLPLRMRQARRRLDAGEVDTSDFDPAHAGWSAARLWDEMSRLVPMVCDPAVTHGDCSLDNILIEGGRVSGCIDVGRAGIADRYQDLAILWNCLGEFDADLRRTLFRAYGEPAPDDRRIKFYLALDEFF